MSNPFNKVARDFAVKMRSKVHKQSYSNSVMERKARQLSPTGRLAVERITELMALQQRHQRTFDPALRTEATQILRTLPLLSTDEDPLFIHTQRALRVAAYFDAVDLPTTYALINQHTKNTFLLDAISMSSFFFTLAKMKHPQTAEIIAILLPRLRELASDLIPREAVHILRVLHRYSVEDTKLIKTLTETVVNTVKDTPLLDVRQCAVILADTYPEEAKRILIAAEKRLCDDIELNTNIDEVKTTMMDVCRVVSLTCTAPRELLNSIARRSLDITPQLSQLDISYILKAFHLSSYRHLRLFRVLSSSQAARVSNTKTIPTAVGVSQDLTPTAVSMTIQALAHFYVTGSEEVVLTLVNAVANELEGLNFALTLLACVRLQCISKDYSSATDILCGSPLRKYTLNAHSLQVTSRLLYALSQLGRCTSTTDIVNIQALLNSVLRARGPISDDVRSFLQDAVVTLDSNSECKDDAVRGLLVKVRERLLCGRSGVSSSVPS
ncbi:uncharacterized protein TM35_000222110 [Trypanosoma theileri]|uniref:Mitochondrial RNA binding protein n=1 Tax=Trypanosoma theileri TaxID=67003 RepID=A0A1X0NRT3_9TRYP|nr:uncharacterized protein TM35_000222110 [Trypanosoma theileri]ORC87412.1 hypothetical protein TM35_000222110 [Trypanosoma theileri]